MGTIASDYRARAYPHERRCGATQELPAGTDRSRPIRELLLRDLGGAAPPRKNENGKRRIVTATVECAEFPTATGAASAGIQNYCTCRDEIPAAVAFLIFARTNGNLKILGIYVSNFIARAPLREVTHVRNIAIHRRN